MKLVNCLVVDVWFIAVVCLQDSNCQSCCYPQETDIEMPSPAASKDAAVKSSEPELWTAPFDSRFPHQNQTRYFVLQV